MHSATSQKKLGCTQNGGFVTSHTPWWTAVVVLLLFFYSMLCCVCVVYYSIIISSRLWLYILSCISKTYWIYRFRWCISTLLIHPKYLDWSLKAYADKCAFNLNKPTRKSQQALGVYLERTTMEVSNRSYATQLAAQTRRIVRRLILLSSYTQG